MYLHKQVSLGFVQMGPLSPGIHLVRIGSGDEKPGSQMYSLTDSRVIPPSETRPLPKCTGGGGHAMEQMEKMTVVLNIFGDIYLNMLHVFLEMF